MQKKDIKLDNNKGIALITLIVAVLMMLIISSIIIYNTSSHLRINNLNNMYNDIRVLNEQVFLYYSKYNELPILTEEYAFRISDNDNMEEAEFHVIDIDKIDRNIKSNLKYGADYYNKNYAGTDIYIINTATHQIFYVKGIKVDDTTYYTIPGGNEYQNISVDEIIANPPKLENNLKPIIYNENESSDNKIIGTNQYDKNWYDYSENTDLSKWARAEVTDNDIYMWVPRYAYNTETNEIVFLKGTTDKPIKETDITGDEWIIPDAFQNKEKEQLTGIWIYLGDDYKKINSKTDLITFVYELTGKDNTNGTANTSITGADYTYYNPVIPVGFKTVPTRDASWRSTNGIQVDGWNDGLVIEDKDGNQFVWVPVDGTNVKYDRYLFSKNFNITNLEILSDDVSAIPVIDETTQINTYEGFYIARYEAGKPSNGTVPLSKYNQTVWTSITYNDASTYAKNYKTENLYVLSGLITGRMWDTTMKWIATTEGLDTVQNDSSIWGIYLGDGKQNTGVGIIGKNTSKKNIYDLAGNVWEWTAEIRESSYRVLRGGASNYEGLSYPAASRTSLLMTHSGASNMRFPLCTIYTINYLIFIIKIRRNR